MNYQYWKKNKNNVHPPYVLYDVKDESMPAGYVDVHVTVPRPQDIVASDAATWKHVTFAWMQDDERWQIHCYIGVVKKEYVACKSDKSLRSLDSYHRVTWPKVIADMIELGVLSKLV